MKNRLDSRLRPFLVPLLLVIAAVLAYSTLGRNDLVRFDDHYYLTDNPMIPKGFTRESIAWAFSLSHSISYWHPMTWLSLMLDYQLFGMNPTAYHLVNLLIHILNALLLFQILKNVTGAFWPSALAAFLFALHPLNVESVAWAVERKTVLSTFFLLLSVVAYIRYVRRPGAGSFLVVVVLFLLGLMAKPMVVTLPLLLLLLDFWPLGRLMPAGSDRHHSGTPSPGRVLVEKAALLLLSLGSVGISLFSLKDVTASAPAPEPIVYRFGHAAISYVHYMFKLVWPVNLGVFYPPQSPSLVLAGAAAVVLAAITLCSFIWLRKRPWLATGWLWYLIAFTPMIGLVRAGLWPSMADRFAYLPFVGLYIIVAWGLAELSATVLRRQVVAVAVAALLVFLACTWHQVGYWRNSITLFERALTVSPDNLLVYANLGESYFAARQYDKAFSLFRKDPAAAPVGIYAGYDRNKRYFPEILNAMEQKVSDPVSLSYLYYLSGKVYEDLAGQVEAVESYLTLLRQEGGPASLRESARRDVQRIQADLGPSLDKSRAYVSSHPSDTGSRWKHAVTLQRLGLDGEALQHYRQLDGTGNGSGALYYRMSKIYRREGDMDGALSCLQKALTFSPSHPELLNDLGLLYKTRKEPQKALATFRKAMEENPAYPNAPFNLAVTCMELGNKEEALKIFRKMQERFPHYNVKIREILRQG